MARVLQSLQPIWETCAEFLAPGFGPAIEYIWEVSQPLGDLYLVCLSGCLSLSPCLSKAEIDSFKNMKWLDSWEFISLSQTSHLVLAAKQLCTSSSRGQNCEQLCLLKYLSFKVAFFFFPVPVMVRRGSGKERIQCMKTCTHFLCWRSISKVSRNLPVREARKCDLATLLCSHYTTWITMEEVGNRLGEMGCGPLA